jgi:type IV pilus assembly protein PilQ
MISGLAQTARTALVLMAMMAPLSAAFAADPLLQNVQIVGGDSTQVTLRLSDTLAASATNAFTMSGPDRLLVDLVGVRLDPGVGVIAGDNVLVDHGEVAELNAGDGVTTRLTLFLKAPVSFNLRTTADAVELILARGSAAADPIASALNTETGGTVTTAEGTASVAAAPRELSGPDAINPNIAVTSLDFQNLPDVSRIVIGLKGTERFTATRPQANLIVIDVPDAFMPQSLGRILDATQFISPVSTVRAYRSSQGTRVAIKLRENAEYRTQMGPNGLLYVDVVVPESMRRARETAEQSWSSVAPSSSSSGLSNNSSSEILISSTGRTSNPQSSFAYGGGANDPSALLGFNSSFSFESSSASSVPYSGQRISLDFVNADIHSIFRLVSHVSRLNIVASDDVKGEITVRMVDVPWDQALAAILQAKGLGSQRFGNIVRVAPIETIKSEQQAALETKRAIDDLEELQVLVLPLNYVQANDIVEQMLTMVSTRGTVQVDTTSNQLIVKETEKKLAQIRELVRHLDRQTPQVLVEARIVEANSNFTRTLGIQWGTSLDASANTGYAPNAFFPSSVGVSGGQAPAVATAETFFGEREVPMMVDLGADSSESSVAFHLGSIPGLVDLDARLSAMETDGWGQVVSTPKATMLDNQTGHVAQGAKIPYLSTSAGGSNVQYINAALELDVTPHITTDNKVFLKVKIQNNRADFSQLVQGQPTIQIKEIETELLVADGDTTVLGGVYSTSESQSQHRTPGLSKIPILGYLFKNSAQELTRNELLVFITPHIVTRATSASTSR